MRTQASLLFLAAVAAAGAREERYRELGVAQLERYGADDSDAARLRHLRKAAVFLRRAGAVPELAKALNLEAGVYYGRKSLSLAEKRNAEALALLPGDAAALRLKAAIEKARKTDIFDQVPGVVGIDRLRARRLAAGVPLRDRGLARRR